MSEMIERVARAVCRANRLDAGFQDTADYTIDDEVGNAWDHFIPEARAAIEAMRSPDKKMLSAACAAMSPGKRPTQKRASERAKHGIRYRAMIDAALTPPQRTETA